jgi:hypothetical protein
LLQLHALILLLFVVLCLLFGSVFVFGVLIAAAGGRTSGSGWCHVKDPIAERRMVLHRQA